MNDTDILAELADILAAPDPITPETPLEPPLTWDSMTGAERSVGPRPRGNPNGPQGL